MTRFRALIALALSFAALALPGQTVDNRDQSYQFYVDGVLTAGVIGYQINFNHSTVSRTDSRHLDTAYSPDQRILSINVTQKGLNRLQDWLNSATSTGAPPAKNLALVVRMTDGTILVRWEFTGATPMTITSEGKGPQTEVAATIGFLFDTMTQVQAKAD